MIDLTSDKIPPGQQLVAGDKWPIIGEREPANGKEPWSVEIGGLVQQTVRLNLAELKRLPVSEIKMDIHCVTRWSRQNVKFAGVFLKDLLNVVKINEEARFISFVSRSQRNHSSSLPIATAIEQNTLIAWQVDGRELEVEHGGPLRNIVPGRYFYKSVKWLEQIKLLAEDELGFWEAQTGYHNDADPWLEQRYMAPTIDRRTAIKLIESRDFSGHDLRSIDASNRDLSGLTANGAQLRDADFRKSILEGADFTNANLSNAHFEDSHLQNANFAGADLEGANLSGADIRGANFTGASLIGSSFVDQLAGGAQRAAILDTATVIPEGILEPLTAEQREFLSKRRL